MLKVKLGGIGLRGEPGLQRTDPDYQPPGPGYFDQALKKNIDFEGMRKEKVAERLERYEKFQEIIKDYPPIVPWEVIRERHGEGKIPEAREEYNSQPAVKALRKTCEFSWEFEDCLVGREEFLRRAEKTALCTFAVVKDGKWYERGEMGWWGCVSDEKDQDQWAEEFGKLLEELPEDTLLTVVDCHI